MSGDHNQYQKDKSYLDFECPRCGHCCQAKGEEHMSREAMQMALEALVQLDGIDTETECVTIDVDDVITALRQALETEQQPVAWIHDGGKGELWWYQSSKFDEEGNLIGPNPDDIPLYTAPPKRKWVGLTADEIWKCNRSEAGNAVEFHICSAHQNVMDFAEAIEAKLKEKNT